VTALLLAVVTNNIYEFLFSAFVLIPCPSNRPWLDHSNCAWRGVNLWGSSVSRFLQFLVTSSLLWSKYSPEHPILKLSDYIPSVMAETKLRTHTKPQANLLPCISHFYFLRQQTRKIKDSGPNGSKYYQFSLLLISSWIKFWFVTVAPEYSYFNFSYNYACV
jgi:hypothetical protein